MQDTTHPTVAEQTDASEHTRAVTNISQTVPGEGGTLLTERCNTRDVTLERLQLTHGGQNVEHLLLLMTKRVKLSYYSSSIQAKLKDSYPFCYIQCFYPDTHNLNYTQYTIKIYICNVLLWKQILCDCTKCLSSYTWDHKNTKNVITKIFFSLLTYTTSYGVPMKALKYHESILVLQQWWASKCKWVYSSVPSQYHIVVIFNQFITQCIQQIIYKSVTKFIQCD